MRELHGVVVPAFSLSMSDLKKQLILFDSFIVPDLNDFVEDVKDHIDGWLLNELLFLQDQAILRDGKLNRYAYGPDSKSYARPMSQGLFRDPQFSDMFVRRAALQFSNASAFDVVPICQKALPEHLEPSPWFFPIERLSCTETVIRIVSDVLPVPDDLCPWQDILAFKFEMRDKLWSFRRFLHDLATKRRTEVEIRDDVEWTLNQYAKEMDRLSLKRSITFMEAYIVPTIEALESLKPSVFVKGVVAIKKHRLEMLEGEGTGDGRFCAYVFDARKRFGPR